MDKESLSEYLKELQVAGWRYYKEIGSTNDAALEWAREGASDWSLVIADSQTKGRGREGRRWVTEAESALAVSLILRPTAQESELVTRFTALGALGLVHALAVLGLQAEIKWPNDVLLARKKTAGILVEGEWQADRLMALVVGIGVNITEKAVPPTDQVRYPATSVESELGKPLDRWVILADILRSMKSLRTIIGHDAFIAEWNQHLAFKDEQISFKQQGQQVCEMKAEGINKDGKLILVNRTGRIIEAVAGEIVISGES